MGSLFPFVCIPVNTSSLSLSPYGLMPHYDPSLPLPRVPTSLGTRLLLSILHHRMYSNSLGA